MHICFSLNDTKKEGRADSEQELCYQGELTGKKSTMYKIHPFNQRL